MTEQETRAAIVAEARTWLRTPYHHAARVKGAGVDCAQILVEVYSAVGLIEWFDAGFYPPDWMLHRDEERYLATVTRFAHPVAAPLPGDVAVYRFGRCISHGAIVVEWPTIIHAYAPDRQVSMGDGMSSRLRPRLAGIYSVFGES